MNMTFTTTPELPVLAVPEAVSKTDKSITLKLSVPPEFGPEALCQYQVAWSEHGIMFYSWQESEVFSARLWPVRGLQPNKKYVFRARVVKQDKQECGEWSPVTAVVRTFTEEEDAKRSGTVFEHALRLEREQKAALKTQLSKLNSMLEAQKKPANKQPIEDMMSSRMIMDTTIHKLQVELQTQTAALHTVKNQRAADEQMIHDLLNEQEHLRAQQRQRQEHSQEMEVLREQLNKNQEALQKYQEQVSASHDEIAAYETSLEAKKKEIQEKEDEVEKLMADCNRMMQEQSDAAQVKQLEIEEALMEAKTSLEQQLDINTYLREEVTRLREECHHLKNQIEEMDSDMVPRLVHLEEENEQLRAQLRRR